MTRYAANKKALTVTIHTLVLIILAIIIILLFSYLIFKRIPSMVPNAPV